MAGRARHFFAYGTLMLPEVMRAVTGDSPRSVRARLEGYARLSVRGECFPALVPQRRGTTAGWLYLDVGDATLALLDRFEGDLYVRRTVEVSLETGERAAAETYIVADGHADELTAEPWDEARFRREDLGDWVLRCRAWRERCSSRSSSADPRTRCAGPSGSPRPASPEEGT